MTKYLTTEQVIEIHDAIIKETGGLSGLRDIRLLESALHAPKAFCFEQEMYKNISEKSVVLLYHLIKNHAFNDGNKRTAYTVVCMFFKINKRPFVHKENLENLCIAIADGTVEKQELLLAIQRIEFHAFWNYLGK